MSELKNQSKIFLHLFHEVKTSQLPVEQSKNSLLVDINNLDQLKETLTNLARKTQFRELRMASEGIINYLSTISPNSKTRKLQIQLSHNHQELSLIPLKNKERVF